MKVTANVRRGATTKPSTKESVEKGEMKRDEVLNLQLELPTGDGTIELQREISPLDNLTTEVQKIVEGEMPLGSMHLICKPVLRLLQMEQLELTGEQLTELCVTVYSALMSSYLYMKKHKVYLRASPFYPVGDEYRVRISTKKGERQTAAEILNGLKRISDREIGGDRLVKTKNALYSQNAIQKVLDREYKLREMYAAGSIAMIRIGSPVPFRAMDEEAGDNPAHAIVRLYSGVFDYQLNDQWLNSKAQHQLLVNQLMDIGKIDVLQVFDPRDCLEELQRETLPYAKLTIGSENPMYYNF